MVDVVAKKAPKSKFRLGEHPRLKAKKQKLGNT